MIFNGLTNIIFSENLMGLYENIFIEILCEMSKIYLFSKTKF